MGCTNRESREHVTFSNGEKAGTEGPPDVNCTVFVPLIEASAVPNVEIWTLRLYLKLLVYPSPTAIWLAIPALATATNDVGDCGIFATAKQAAGSVCVNVPPVEVAVQVAVVTTLPNTGSARLAIRARPAPLNSCVISEQTVA
jgi:hypothetical protein